MKVFINSLESAEKLSNFCKKFDCDINAYTCKNRVVDAKSLLGVVSLGFNTAINIEFIESDSFSFLEKDDLLKDELKELLA